jgi:acyl-coenzyme A synthetase/AMP-(fatty) acid ligase
MPIASGSLTTPETTKPGRGQPDRIEFIDALPMTTTGKVQRRVLRLRGQERAAATLGRANDPG